MTKLDVLVTLRIGGDRRDVVAELILAGYLLRPLRKEGLFCIHPNGTKHLTDTLTRKRGS